MKRMALTGWLWALLLLCGCVENDLPYPTIVGEIEEFAVEGQTSIKINKAEGTIAVKVVDTIDLRNLRVEKLVVTEGMQVIPDSAACKSFTHFPDSGFVSADSLPASANTRMDFSQPVSFLLRLYQDYTWRVTAESDITRKVEIENQLGTALIDVDTRNAIVYVDSTAQPSLRDVHIKTLQLGRSNAVIAPDPQRITDFTRPRVFFVTSFGQTEEWTVSVAYPPKGMSFTTLAPWAKHATLKGTTRTGQVSAIYRELPAVVSKAEGEWESVLASEIRIDEEGNFTLTFTHLKPATTYEFQVTVDGVSEEVKQFTTEAVQTVPNLSFDDWYKDGKSWYPNINLDPENYFWDTGNKGSNAVGEANPTSPETADVIRGKAARMESKTVAGVFAAGSFYTGAFNKVEGLNGASLYFGRPFTGRPTALAGYYKYNCGTIDKAKDPYKELIGRPDTANIYMALFSGWSAPFLVNTNEGTFVDLTWNNDNLLAFGEIRQGQTIKEYTRFRIDLQYRDETTKPTYALIVASASVFGDYFTGSTSSVLLVDELELIYE
ncbi:PCMD domain-containing protein [Parabacteroides distasonis]|nr:PCMD domain-containing protein [Parabacteroides distasonis]